MNNPYKSFIWFTAFTGIILFLVSISFIPLTIDKLLENYFTTEVKERRLAEEINFQSIEHDLLNQNMNELNIFVNNTNQEINNLILRSGAINDTINKLIEKSRKNLNLVDTIQELFNNDILVIEKKIDSLNEIFEEKSNELFQQVKAFNIKDRDLKIIREEQQAQEKLTFFKFFTLIEFCVFFVFCFFGGIILFITGLKKWRFEYSRLKNQQQESIDLNV
jgi:hypothetical protein